jgi:hypothetical protein
VAELVGKDSCQVEPELGGSAEVNVSVEQPEETLCQRYLTFFHRHWFLRVIYTSDFSVRFGNKLVYLRV